MSVAAVSQGVSTNKVLKELGGYGSKLVRQKRSAKRYLTKTLIDVTRGADKVIKAGQSSQEIMARIDEVPAKYREAIRQECVQLQKLGQSFEKIGIKIKEIFGTEEGREKLEQVLAKFETKEGRAKLERLSANLKTKEGQAKLEQVLRELMEETETGAGTIAVSQEIKEESTAAIQEIATKNTAKKGFLEGIKNFFVNSDVKLIKNEGAAKFLETFTKRYRNAVIAGAVAIVTAIILKITNKNKKHKKTNDVNALA